MGSAGNYILSLHTFADAAATRDVTYVEVQKAKSATDEIERVTPGCQSMRSSIKAIVDATSDATRKRAARSLKVKLLRLGASYLEEKQNDGREQSVLYPDRD